jgi:hypothetical protein
LKPIKRSASTCEENYSGIGTSVYVAFVEDLEAQYDYSASGEMAGFDESAFKFKQGKGFYQLDIKKKSGKVTSESNPQGGGFNNVLTFVVNNNMDEMAYILRTINNVDTMWLISDGKDAYYAMYDPQFAPEVTSSGDTGDTPDSDRGFTMTITASPARYPMAKWKGTPQVVADQSVQG